MQSNDRRLIEDLIPIREISAEASREKSLRHGNISTLHLWWARRPIVAARAAVYGALVPAPTTPEERQEGIQTMQRLCRWDIPGNALEEARQTILAANDGHPPRVLDMFAGGGAIPLEALRLGCEAYAVDLNPVAHIIELCTLLYPQKYGSSLITDVKKWGELVIEQAKEQLTDFYPSPGAKTATDGESAIGQLSFMDDKKHAQSDSTLTPIAYLWTRTVSCPNPSCGASVPLVRQTWLRKKADNYVALRLIPDHVTQKVRFELVQSPTIEGLGFDPEAGSKRGIAICSHCGATVATNYIKQEGRVKRIGQQLMAVVLTKLKEAGKIYISEDEGFSTVIEQDILEKKIQELCRETNIDPPDELINNLETRWFAPPDYGFLRFKDIFTSRQLLTLLTFTAKVHQAYNQMIEEGMEAKRAKAIATYLGLMIDRLAENLSTLCRWNASGGKLQGTFGRQALPMVWDFAEANPFGGSVGDANSILYNITNIVGYLIQNNINAVVIRTTATSLPISDSSIDAVITDPPYYDNVSYADLSDFFYVWLKRSIGFLYPEHFGTSLTPKKQEAIMAAYRHNKSKETARHSYETMMAQAFSEAHRVLKSGAPLICVYAHKTTLGWSTLIEALRHAGFVIVEAWPLDTEMKSRSVAQGTAALASSIFLVARRRENEETGDYVRQVRPQLASIIAERLTTLIEAGVTGADLIIATIGAGLKAYTQFARVEMPNGDELDATTYLAEIEREVAYHVLQRLLQSAEGETNATGVQVAGIDTITRFYVTGRFFYNDIAAPFDDMNLLARGMGVELDGPHGLAQGKQGLAKKEKDTIQLCDYRGRGDNETLGLPTQSGNSAALIDVLQRLLWLQDERPYEVQAFLLKAHHNHDQLRLVAQALSGRALAPASETGASKQNRTDEQKAIDRLLAGWRNIFTEMAGQTLWG